MSHSRRRTPIHGNTCHETEHQDKQWASRQQRRRARIALRVLGEHFEPVRPGRWENPWKWDKDGKQWFGNVCPELLRK